MPSMHIVLSEPLKPFVDGQMAQGRYSSASEYMCELLVADVKCKAEDQLEEKLLAGLNSPEIELDSKEWICIHLQAQSILKSGGTHRCGGACSV